MPNAADALALLQDGERYDAVVCELMMPVMDGIEFHRRLAAMLPEEAKRIVFITGGARRAHHAGRVLLPSSSERTTRQADRHRGDIEGLARAD